MDKKTFYHLFFFHRWLGSLIAMILFVVLLSGTVTLFRDEIRVWSQHASKPQPSHPIAVKRVALLDQLLESLQKVQPLSTMKKNLLRLPDKHAIYYELLYSLPSSNKIYRKQFDVSAGAYQGDIKNQLADFIFQLHAYFTTKGKLGRYLLGFLGVLMLLSLVSGFLIHNIKFKVFYTFRRHQGKRTLLLDLHKLLGVWTLLFLLMMGYTGAFLGLKDWLILPMGYLYYDGDKQQARQAFSTLPRLPKATGEQAHMVSLDSIVKQAQHQVPGFKPRLLSFINWHSRQAVVRVAGNLPNTLLPKNEAVIMRYSGVTGELLDLDNGLEHSSVRRVYDAISPLHYGDFFGIQLKIIYAVFSIFGMLLLVSGIELWLLRREK